jgi:hypothetical protein
MPNKLEHRLNAWRGVNVERIEGLYDQGHLTFLLATTQKSSTL